MRLVVPLAVILLQARSTFALTQTKDVCGGTLSTRNGTLTSPITASVSGQSSICNWTIDARGLGTTEHLELRVLAVSLQGFMPTCHGGEYLEVFIGCGLASVGRFCGVQALPVFYSADGCMGIVLQSQGRREFRATYSLRPLNQAIQHIPGGCGLSMHDNTRHGNIFSPLWPLPYPQYVDCIWTVSTRKDLQIKLIFFDFDVQANARCINHDYIEVRVGNHGYAMAKTLTQKQECGRREPFSILVGSGTLYVMFRSVRTSGLRGFMAGFVAYRKEAEGFDPQVLIILGVVFLLVFAVVIKMVVVPKLIRMLKTKLTAKGIKSAMSSAFATKRPRRVSFRRLRSFRQVHDYPVISIDRNALPPGPTEGFPGNHDVTTISTSARESFHVPIQGGEDIYAASQVDDVIHVASQGGEGIDEQSQGEDGAEEIAPTAYEEECIPDSSVNINSSIRPCSSKSVRFARKQSLQSGSSSDVDSKS